jgi:DNA-binding NtrC family response regulator
VSFLNDTVWRLVQLCSGGAIRRLALTTPRTILQGGTILIVEDEFLIALGLEDAFKEAGVSEVIIAQNMLEARRALSREPPVNAAVFDVQLDGKGDAGFALAEIAVTRNIPFVFLTAYAPGLVLPERFDGATMVPKPYSMATLVRAVAREMMRGRQAL